MLKNFDINQLSTMLMLQTQLKPNIQEEQKEENKIYQQQKIEAKEKSYLSDEEISELSL